MKVKWCEKCGFKFDADAGEHKCEFVKKEGVEEVKVAPKVTK